jgi:hypothetical protein
MTHACSHFVPIGAPERYRDPAGESSHKSNKTAFVLVAEADGNRTRQRRGTPLSGFEDQGDHQEPRRLRPRLY